MTIKTSDVIKLVRHHWLTVSFLLGFITDFILLNRVDNLIDNLTLLFYVLLATVSLLLLYVGVAERGPNFLVRWIKKYIPILMQYSFGGLLSGMLIFYGRSGDWLASAPFLVLIVAVIFGNEFVNKRSDKLIYHLILYFIGIFSYIVLVVPIIIGKMGDGIFFLSGLIALIIVSFVVQILYRIVPNFMNANTRRVIVTIGGIYVGFNILYFTNIIPPIPLSLTELEMAESVVRMGDGNYRVVMEKQPWYESLPFIHQTLHPTEGSIACFAKVFAPTNLSTEIFHRWEYKDADGNWQEHFRFGYNISGSNDKGYRGYTEMQSFSSGKWRCSVETKRGQVLGRKVFYIDTAGESKATIVRVE
jgi:hypothetical protein